MAKHRRIPGADPQGAADWATPRPGDPAWKWAMKITLGVPWLAFNALNHHLVDFPHEVKTLFKGYSDAERGFRRAQRNVKPWRPFDSKAVPNAPRTPVKRNNAPPLPTLSAKTRGTMALVDRLNLKLRKPKVQSPYKPFAKNLHLLTRQLNNRTGQPPIGGGVIRRPSQVDPRLVLRRPTPDWRAAMKATKPAQIAPPRATTPSLLGGAKLRLDPALAARMLAGRSVQPGQNSRIRLQPPMSSPPKFRGRIGFNLGTLRQPQI